MGCVAPESVRDRVLQDGRARLAEERLRRNALLAEERSVLKEFFLHEGTDDGRREPRWLRGSGLSRWRRRCLLGYYHLAKGTAIFASPSPSPVRPRPTVRA